MCCWEICTFPFAKSLSVYYEPLELIEIDLWGPAPISSNGNLYYMSVVDVATRYSWIYFLRKKINMTCIFVEFHSLVERQLGHLLKFVQTDGGGEFKSLTPFLV